MTIYGGANDGLYVIELKSPSLDTYFMDSIHQNFKQLRHFCIAKQKASMLGIYSNLKKWIFTRYSLIDEIKTGSYSGQSRLMKETGNLIPGITQIYRTYGKIVKAQ